MTDHSLHALWVILCGAGLGALLSIPPGPAGALILAQALRGATRPALRALGAFLLAEVLVMAAALVLLRGVSGVALPPWLRGAAGVFLLGFALRGFYGLWRSADTSAELGDAGAAFRVTLVNPAVWLGGVSLLTAAPGDGSVGARLLFLLGLELGTVLWFLALITAARRVPVRLRAGVEAAALGVIALSGAVMTFDALRAFVGAR